MPGTSDSGRINFSFDLGTAKHAQSLDPEAPFRVVLLGDFSGRESRGVREPLQGRLARAVDVDNLDQVLEWFGAKLALSGVAIKDGPAEFAFTKLEDFHPDQLLPRLGQPGRLLALRREMSRPGNAPAAAAELRALLGTQAGEAAQGAPPASTLQNKESDADTLSRLLGGVPPPASPAPGPEKTPALTGLFREAAKADIVAAPSSEDHALASLADLEIQNALRAILHAPAFQQLEAAWRSLDLLVRKFGGDERVKLLVLDCTKEEMAADAPGLAKAVIRSSEQGAWGLWAGLFRFGTAESDFTLLARIATIAAHLRAPFVANANPALAGAEFPRQPYPEDWKPLPSGTGEFMAALRGLPEAKWLGLAMPRFLLRQPYGKGSDQIESVAFEELTTPPVHDDYLWGNPAVVCAALMAESFLENGWSMDLNAPGRLGDLPVHRFRENDETVMKPCAELWLSDRAGEALLSRGFIPVLSVKNSDAVQVYKLCSVSSERTLLAGKWSAYSSI